MHIRNLFDTEPILEQVPALKLQRVKGQLALLLLLLLLLLILLVPLQHRRPRPPSTPSPNMLLQKATIQYTILMDSYLPFTNQASLARKDLLPMATFSRQLSRTTYIQAATPTLTMPTLVPRWRLKLLLEVLGTTAWLWSPQPLASLNGGEPKAKRVKKKITGNTWKKGTKAQGEVAHQP